MIERKGKIEIMAPAGNFECLHAAIQGGADSVYFGVEKLNMRSHSANNFRIDDLPEIVRICSGAGVKTYLTLNIVLYEEDLSDMRRTLDIAKEAGITAVIASDMAAIAYARGIGVEVHISTQLSISNSEALKFYARFADVIVLARELNLNQVKEIRSVIDRDDVRGPSGRRVEIEMFVHGALCMAISGKCYLSLHEYGASANRGACYQICRRGYEVTDLETGNSLVVDNKYIMSPKDLCTVEFIDKISRDLVRRTRSIAERKSRVDHENIPCLRNAVRKGKTGCVLEIQFYNRPVPALRGAECSACAVAEISRRAGSARRHVTGGRLLGRGFPGGILLLLARGRKRFPFRLPLLGLLFRSFHYPWYNILRNLI